MSALLTAAAAAASVGLGCGTCCGSASTAFLSTYIITEGKGFVGSLRYTGSFYLGKLLAVMGVCALAAALGCTVADDQGRLFGLNARLILSCVLLAASLWLLADWFVQRRSCARHACHRCGGGKALRVAPTLGMGLAYGLSPCAPLLMVVGSAALLDVPSALVLGLVFALASSLTPVLLLAGLSGALSGKIARQLQAMLPWLRLGLYAAFAIAAAVSLCLSLL